MRGMALANPHLRMLLRHNKKLLWQHASCKELRAGVGSVFGSAADMVYFSSQEQNGFVFCYLSGYIIIYYNNNNDKILAA